MSAAPASRSVPLRMPGKCSPSISAEEEKQPQKIYVSNGEHRQMRRKSISETSSLPSQDSPHVQQNFPFSQELLQESVAPHDLQLPTTAKSFLVATPDGKTTRYVPEGGIDGPPGISLDDVVSKVLHSNCQKSSAKHHTFIFLNCCCCSPMSEPCQSLAQCLQSGTEKTRKSRDVGLLQHLQNIPVSSFSPFGMSSSSSPNMNVDISPSLSNNSGSNVSIFHVAERQRPSMNVDKEWDESGTLFNLRHTYEEEEADDASQECPLTTLSIPARPGKERRLQKGAGREFIRSSGSEEQAERPKADMPQGTSLRRVAKLTSGLHGRTKKDPARQERLRREREKRRKKLEQAANGTGGERIARRKRWESKKASFRERLRASHFGSPSEVLFHDTSSAPDMRLADSSSSSSSSYSSSSSSHSSPDGVMNVTHDYMFIEGNEASSLKATTTEGDSRCTFIKPKRTRKQYDPGPFIRETTGNRKKMLLEVLNGPREHSHPKKKRKYTKRQTTRSEGDIGGSSPDTKSIIKGRKLSSAGRKVRSAIIASSVHSPSMPGTQNQVLDSSVSEKEAEADKSPLLSTPRQTTPRASRSSTPTHRSVTLKASPRTASFLSSPGATSTPTEPYIAIPSSKKATPSTPATNKALKSQSTPKYCADSPTSNGSVSAEMASGISDLVPSTDSSAKPRYRRRYSKVGHLQSVHMWNNELSQWLLVYYVQSATGGRCPIKLRCLSCKTTNCDCDGARPCFPCSSQGIVCVDRYVVAQALQAQEKSSRDGVVWEFRPDGEEEYASDTPVASILPVHCIGSDVQTAIRGEVPPVSEVVKAVYSEIQRISGIGGAIPDAPLYGEITRGSFHKIITFLIEVTRLNQPGMSFIDLGSGLGKPSMHMAVDPRLPHLNLSFGLEVNQYRYELAVANLRAAHAAGISSKLIKKVFYDHLDVKRLGSLTPFTHVYSFDIGFPPDVLEYMGSIFNQSNSCKYFICYHSPKVIIVKAGFEVNLIGRINASMHGSGESHTVYVYEKVCEEDISRATPIAPSIQAGINQLSKEWWVGMEMRHYCTEENLSRGPMTRQLTDSMDALLHNDTITRESSAAQLAMPLHTKGERKMKGLYCHQCVRKSDVSRLIFCSTCPNRYCYLCVHNYYTATDWDIAMRCTSEWQCFSCTHICSCAWGRNGTCGQHEWVRKEMEMIKHVSTGGDSAVG